MVEPKAMSKQLSIQETEQLLSVLKERFGKNMSRHGGLKWADVQARLEANPEKLWSLNQMEITEGEPDVVGYDANTITVEMTKVKKQVTIPLMYVTKDIIEKYGKHTIKSKTTLVLPQITNQALNRDLKVLMKKAGINKPISFHSSRHTFASNLIEAKTNILYVKDLLGHSKITGTQIYAKSLQADLRDSMENLAAMYNKAI